MSDLDSDVTMLNPRCPDCKTPLHYSYEKDQWDCAKCGGWYKFITDESKRKQELASIRNQLAEAQRELAPRNGHTFDSLQKMWENTHIELASVISERDQLKQQLLACELNRSKAKDFILLAEVSSSWETTLLNVRIARAVLREVPNLALTETLKPVREALKMGENTLTEFGRHKDETRIGLTLRTLEHAISTLDKLCAKGD